MNPFRSGRNSTAHQNEGGNKYKRRYFSFYVLKIKETGQNRRDESLGKKKKRKKPHTFGKCKVGSFWKLEGWESLSRSLRPPSP